MNKNLGKLVNANNPEEMKDHTMKCTLNYILGVMDRDYDDGKYNEIISMVKKWHDCISLFGDEEGTTQYGIILNKMETK